ncbi:putative bifunctional diguanylate cyclase/phosphodiesterase [Hirschia litorea]|uniref:Bifunctional diguanylate cyclase/phosphodiesterase n=1 Tax=Hirschia litorea TaxID=1199156 RepID=A0ABW2IGJ1_9PROT
MHSISTIDKRETLIGSVIGFFLIFCIGYYIYTSVVGVETLATERKQNELVSSGLLLETKVIGLRKLEKDFAIERKLELLSEFETIFGEIYSEIDARWLPLDIEEAVQLQSGLLKYHASARKLFEFHKSIGLDQNSGLEGQLRIAAHSAESKIQELGDSELLANLMYLRRHEKDFMLRDEPKYMQRYFDRMHMLKAQIEERIGQTSLKRDLILNLEDYSRNFTKWSENRQRLNNTIEEIDQAFAIVDSVMSTLIRLSFERAKYAKDQGNIHRSLSQLSILLLGLLGAIGIGLLVSVIYRHKKLSLEIDKLAYIDALTSLPNRRCFFRELKELNGPKAHVYSTLSVGIIDLDGFKAVNDIHGHGAGDQLLSAVGRRLEGLMDEGVFLARLGGDEFGIIVSNGGTEDDLAALGATICASLKSPFTLNDAVVRIAGTVGFAQLQATKHLSESLFECADYALYHAKENCKGTSVTFSTQHELQISGKRKMEQCLLDADLEAELQVFFQPIVDCVAGHVVGMEALARWTSPVIGVVPPDKFIPAAENLGIVGGLSSILLRKALAAAKSWPENTYLSFNLSAIDISSNETALNLMAIIMKSGFAPHRIVFEITETTMMLNFQHANEVLKPFRNMGVGIALDDFGTGYSSLSYIQKMPIDRLKIDRAFISDIETRKTTRDIMMTIVDLCRSLDVTCIVEGVETYKQLETVQLLGCQLIQGYYFSKPLNIENAQSFLEGRSSQSVNDWHCGVRSA